MSDYINCGLRGWKLFHFIYSLMNYMHAYTSCLLIFLYLVSLQSYTPGWIIILLLLRDFSFHVEDDQSDRAVLARIHNNTLINISLGYFCVIKEGSIDHWVVDIGKGIPLFEFFVMEFWWQSGWRIEKKSKKYINERIITHKCKVSGQIWTSTWPKLKFACRHSICLWSHLEPVDWVEL